MTQSQFEDLLDVLKNIQHILKVQVEFETGNKINFTQKEVEHVAKSKKKKD